MNDHPPAPDTGAYQPAQQTDRHTTLLEQSMTALGSIQQRLMKEQPENLDLLSRSMPRLAIAIVQTARLHHQIGGGTQDPLGRLAAILQSATVTEADHGEETP